MTLRVAAWQCRSQPGDVDGNLHRLALVCERAAADGVDVVVTPELYLSGYAIDEATTRRLAEPVDGPSAAAVAELTARTGVAVVFGFPEAAPGGRISNTAALVDGGEVVGWHRKMHLFGEIDRHRFTPAPDASGVATLRGHRVGLLVCYDVEFPEATRALRLQGAEILLVPTANMVGYELVNTMLVRARALENGCFVVYANYCGSEADLTYCGLSTICAPDGAVLEQAGQDEVLLVADLDPSQPVPTATHLADRRSDLYDRPAADRP